MNKEDLRVQRTKKMIEEGFFDLVVEKGYNKITVSDIAKKAMINRNTFYLHYLDKDDLLEKTFLSRVGKQKTKIDEILKTYKFNDPTNLVQILHDLIIVILDMFEEDIEFYRIVLLDVDTMGHFSYTSNFIKNAILGNQVFTGEKRITFDFIYGGVFECLTHWIKYDHEKKEVIAKQLSLMLADVIKYFD